MCLTIRKDDKENFLPKVAEKDIVCYKILKFDDDGNYRTPYENCDVNVKEVFKANTGKEYSSEYQNKYWNMSFPENALEGDIHHNRDIEEYSLGPGMIHVFASLEDAKLENLECVGLLNCIWKCIIPAGTPYYDGKYTDTMSCYGAEEIKFVERIYN